MKNKIKYTLLALIGLTSINAFAWTFSGTGQYVKGYNAGKVYNCSGYWNPNFYHDGQVLGARNFVAVPGSCGTWGCPGLYSCIETQEPPPPPPPTPEPVIIDDPCPSGSSSMNKSNSRMADSTSIGGSLCAQKLTIGFDANGIANSLITEHSTTSTQSISAATSFANKVRSGNADSTNIGQAPNSASYSDFSLSTNANGQTVISNTSAGTQYFR